jgi:hypothetical protein
MTHVTCDSPGTLDSAIHVRKLMEAAKDQAVGLLPKSLPRHTERTYRHALMVLVCLARAALWNSAADSDGTGQHHMVI